MHPTTLHPVVSAQRLYINLQRYLCCRGTNQEEGHRRWGWGGGETRNILAIHSSNHLTAELLLVQSSQHSLPAVRSAHQIDHKHLGAHKRRLLHTWQAYCIVFGFVCACVCLYLIKPHLVRLLGRKRQEAGGLQGRIFHFQREKNGGGGGGLQREWVMYLKQGFTNSGPRVPQEISKYLPNRMIVWCLLWFYRIRCDEYHSDMRRFNRGHSWSY